MEMTKKFVTAKVIHVHDGLILEASTKEWAIKKQLYKYCDVSAYMNLASVTFQIFYFYFLISLKLFNFLK